MQTHTNTNTQMQKHKLQVDNGRVNGQWGAGDWFDPNRSCCQSFWECPAPHSAHPPKPILNIHTIILVMVVKTEMALFVSSACTHSADHSHHIFQTNLSSTSSTSLREYIKCINRYKTRIVLEAFLRI